MESEKNITELVNRFYKGDKQSENKLFAVCYDLFKGLAREAKHSLDNPKKIENIVLETTSLIHEAYIKIGSAKITNIRNRKSFYILVNKIMRNILIDHYRKIKAVKRKQKGVNITPDPLHEDGIINYLAIDKALNELEKEYPRQAEALQLKYFHGLRIKEIARLQDISESQVDKDLKFSKSWISAFV